MRSKPPYPNPSNTWDGGLFTPGWHCQADDCGVFNGEMPRIVKEDDGRGGKREVEVKQTRAECRSCGRPRGWRERPEDGDPGEVGCRTLHQGSLAAPIEHPRHEWTRGSARCLRCGAHAIRGHFGEELRQKKLAKGAA